MTEHIWQKLHRFGEKRFLVSICGLLFFVLAAKVWLGHYAHSGPGNPAYGIPVAFGVGASMALGLLVSVNMPNTPFIWALRLVGGAAVVVGLAGLGLSIFYAWPLGNEGGALSLETLPLAALGVFILLGIGLWILASPQLVVNFWPGLSSFSPADLTSPLSASNNFSPQNEVSEPYAYYASPLDIESGGLAQDWENALSSEAFEPSQERVLQKADALEPRVGLYDDDARDNLTPDEMPEVPRALLEVAVARRIEAEETRPVTQTLVEAKPRTPVYDEEGETKPMRPRIFPRARAVSQV